MLTKKLDSIFKEGILIDHRISEIIMNINLLEALVIKGLAKQSDTQVCLLTRDQMENSTTFFSEKDLELLRAKDEFLDKNPDFYNHNYVLNNLHKLAKEYFFEKYLEDDEKCLILPILRVIKNNSIELGVKIRAGISDLCELMKEDLNPLLDEADAAASQQTLSAAAAAAGAAPAAPQESAPYQDAAEQGSQVSGDVHLLEVAGEIPIYNWSR